MNDIAKNLLHSVELKSKISQLMWAASDAILEVYHSDDIGLQQKADASPVTEADLAAHHILVKGLESLAPNIPVVSEEDPHSLEIPKHHKTFWMIDPLDGTKEFVQRNGEFTCNVALIDQQETVYGWVSVPAENLLYHGGRDFGAMRQKRADHALPIQCQPYAGPVRIVVSKSHLNTETKEFIEAMGEINQIIQAGSSLKFLRIAENHADVYPRLAPTCEWDTAAAHAILEGAGGTVTGINGEILLYGKTEILNPYFIARAD